MQKNRFAISFINLFTLFLFTFALPAVSQDKAIVNNVYTEKGLAGKQTLEQLDDNSYRGRLELGWNNRRVEIDETVEVNKQGMPISFKANGLSAFGAPIEEQFTLKDGIATWEGLKDDGQVQVTGSRFYTPADQAGVTNDLLVRKLLASPTGKVELLPNGTASLTELKTVTVQNNGVSKEVKLYAVSGLGLNPDYSWYDTNGDFFAQDVSGFLRIIRDGFSLDNFDYLANIQKAAEQEYMETQAKRLSQTFDSLLITNVQLVDVDNGKAIPQTDVLIEQGKITQIGQNLTANAELTVDGKGKTLIPGLWDMHGHLDKSQGMLNIATGVTSVRDIGNNHENIMQIEALFDTNKVIGNRVYRAGFMDQYSEYSAGLSVRSLEEAHEKIDWFADNGYLQIKLYSSINPNWVTPIAKHAHRRGMRVSGHIPAFMTAEQAVRAGYDEIQHVNMLFLNFLAGTTVDTRKQLRFSLIGEKAGALDLDSQKVKDFIQLLADNQIVIDLTVSTFRSLLLKKNKIVDPEFADIAAHLPSGLVRQLKGAEMNVAPEFVDNYQAGADAMLDMVKLLYDAGVPIVPGTDNIAGFTLLRELILYEQAGIPAMDVLKIATINSAKLIGVAHKTGSIAQGKQADLVLIDGDPLKSMHDLRKASLVIKGDQLYLPEVLFGSLGVKPFTAGANIQKKM
jgi:imidazolonepropionase-like amidohydrolase